MRYIRIWLQIILKQTNSNYYPKKWDYQILRTKGERRQKFNRISAFIFSININKNNIQSPNMHYKNVLNFI